MTNSINFFDTMPAHSAAATVELFDAPMCCPTGLCGPSLDQTLLDVNQMVSALQSEGIAVERYQMTSQPQAFLSNPEVIRLVREQEMAALPITVVRGRVIKVGAYPSLAEIKAALEGAPQ